MTNGEILQRAHQAVIDFLLHPDQWNISLAGTGAIYSLEKKFAKLVGHPYALTVTNATSGLWAIFEALDIHNSDVITTPYTWGGALAGVILAGNRPVFADIERHTLTIDSDSVRRCITPRTKAILTVDIYGYPSNGPELRKIADEYGLVLIQDCSQSFGAYIGGRHTGWWSDAAVFSLTFGKALFAGEGGIIVTGNEELFNRLVWQTQHPYRQMRDVPELPLNEMAMNLRMHPLSAVWADAVFSEVLSVVEVYRNHCLKILEFLAMKKLIRTRIPDIQKVKPSFHIFTFEPCCEVSKIGKLLNLQGWNYNIVSPPVIEPIYCQEMYKKLSIQKRWPAHNRCSVAEGQCKRRLRLMIRESVNNSGSIHIRTSQMKA